MNGTPPIGLLAAVERMRQLQVSYFRTRDARALADSKLAEAEVDRLLPKYKADPFAELVARLRDRQKEYFRAFEPAVLREAKDYERRVDERIREAKGGGTRSLFDGDQPAPEPPAPFVRDSDTSAAAAASIEPHAATLRGQVLAFIRSRGDRGATDEEVQDGLPMEANTQRPRRVELFRLGKIRPAAGFIRRTKAGRVATVWVATETTGPEGAA